MEKYGIVTEDSQSDFNPTKKAKYYDNKGFAIADEDNKHLLKEAKEIAEEKDRD